MRMRGGKIIIKGNRGKLVGGGMTGGTIRIEGELESLEKDIRDGKIYHKGKLIFPKED
jgi:formylmethanofuran dehydrogenase subunit C